MPIEKKNDYSDNDIPLIDPTINVQHLLDQAVTRQDDLRLAEKCRVDEQLALRAHYEGLLRDSEAKRIDAIRVVDVNAVSVAAERSAAQAQVLANQVSASADTLRALVSSTASTVAQQLAQVQTQFSDRIAILERAQYEGKGKESISDPMMVSLLSEVKAMREANSQNSGKGIGMNALWGYIIGGAGLLAVLLKIFNVY